MSKESMASPDFLEPAAPSTPEPLGLELEDQVEVLSGIHEGETVILTGGYGLGDKAKIKVKS